MLDDLEDITPIGIDNLPTPIALKAKTSVSKSSTAIIKADPAPKVSNLKKQDIEAVVGEYDDEDEDQYEESEGEYDDEDDNTRVSKNELKAKSKHALSHYIQKLLSLIRMQAMDYHVKKCSITSTKRTQESLLKIRKVTLSH